MFFYFGYKYEIKRYRESVYEEIPIFAIRKAKNEINIVNEKIKFIENKDGFSKIRTKPPSGEITDSSR